MKPNRLNILVLVVFLIGAALALGWAITHGDRDDPGAGRGARPDRRPVPVETAAIERGPIAQVRTFSGELEALAEFVVAPKVSGRVERVLVNIGDTVTRGQVVAELDNEEYVQAVAQAEADRVVARANLSEAESALEIANREFQRTDALVKSGIASDSEYDAGRRDLLVKQAQVKVAEAQVAKAEASLQTANIRLGYTQVTADWSGGDAQRVVAERYVDEGQTVAANAQLLLIVALDPIVGVVHATEKDYGHLQFGQAVALTTDAYPDEVFSGRIDRIAPIFRRTTRQARIEMIVDNPRYRLKPGMFIRATLTLARVAEAVIVPEQALTRRRDRDGVFILAEDGASVIWREVRVGIRAGDRVQVEGTGLSGRVVTLGQQLVDDGSAITIPAETRPTGAGGKAAVE